MANLSWSNLLLTFSAGQIVEWGADGVIIGSAMVKQFGEAASPQEGLQRLEDYASSMKNALPWKINVATSCTGPANKLLRNEA